MQRAATLAMQWLQFQMRSFRCTCSNSAACSATEGIRTDGNRTPAVAFAMPCWEAGCAASNGFNISYLVASSAYKVSMSCLCTRHKYDKMSLAWSIVKESTDSNFLEKSCQFLAILLDLEFEKTHAEWNKMKHSRVGRCCCANHATQNQMQEHAKGCKQYQLNSINESLISINHTSTSLNHSTNAPPRIPWTPRLVARPRWWHTGDIWWGFNPLKTIIYLDLSRFI